MTADEAVKIVKSGDYLHYGLFTGVVVDLDRALAKRVNELEDVTICSTMWSYAEPPEILKADPKAEHFHYSSSHFTPIERKCNKAGNCWFLPVQFRENTKFYEECRPTLEANEVEKAMAGHIVKLIESSSTLQLGTGGFPNYVGKLIAESEINDLSVHTEMFVDAYLHLFKAGKLTNNKKLNKGKMTYTFAMGSQELYDWIDDNQMMQVASVEYVNDVDVISQTM